MIGIRKLIAVGCVTAFLVLTSASCAWEVLDDLTYDGLIMFAVIRNDADSDSNPVASPIPSWFKDWYWQRKGRAKLYIQLKLSPETRTIARHILIDAYENELQVDSKRSAEVIHDLAEAERTGVAVIGAPPCGKPFSC